ncbi:cutinase family protein [Nocardia sp. NPDC004068]|uniref:cutinase family protein n=1 Tax=Nocardia sp. NPDC004068 TaxID=3364303 RepID=UPI0036CF575A
MNALLRVGVGAVTVATAAVLVAVPGPAGAEPSSKSDCPVLYALGVQGTGESSPDAPMTTDTGMLSNVFTPFQAEAEAAGLKVAREYVPYDAGFGGLVPGGTESFEQSVSSGKDRLSQKVSEIAARCPATFFALAGYSQGAYVDSLLAQDIGHGRGPIPADKVAAVALFGDPTRNTDASPFPGANDRESPEAAPGTTGSAVSTVAQLIPEKVTGGGIGPQRDIATDFGSLTGRVASFCSPGDLACDAPDHAPLLHAVANIAGQSQFGGDPLKALGSITQALAMTGIKTATDVINQDISGNSLATLSLNPKESISKRIAEASDPRTPVDPGQVIQALFKVATIGINSAVTVVRTLLTPANIAEIAAAGLADPVAGLAVFGGKLLGALPQIIPPATASRMVQQTFTAFVGNLQDNQDMLQATTWVKYSDVIQRHGSYANDPVSADGKSATKYVADWFVAAAKDAAASGGAHAASDPSASAPQSTPAPSTSSRAPWTFQLNPSSAPTTSAR